MQATPRHAGHGDRRRGPQARSSPTSRGRGAPRLRRAGRRHRGRARSARRSRAWPVPTPSVPTTAFTCSTRWATPSPSCARSRSASPASAVIVGAGYIGLEMAEGLTARGLTVTQMEQLPEVLPTVDPEPRRPRPRASWPTTASRCGPARRSSASARGARGTGRPLPGRRRRRDGRESTAFADMVLVVVGVRPDTDAGRRRPGPNSGIGGAIAVDRHMRTNLDARLRRRRLRRHPPPAPRHSPTCRSAPRPTSRAGWPARTPSAATGSSPAASAPRWSRSSTWRRPAPGCATTRRRAAGFDPVTVEFEADDHKAYYPGSHRIRMRYTGDRSDRPAPRRPALRPQARRGGQADRHRRRRHLQRDDRRRHERARPLYTPPLGSPWDAVQVGGPGVGPEAGA